MRGDQQAFNRAAGEQLLTGHRMLRAQLADIRAALSGGPGAPRPTAAASLADQLRMRCLEYCHGLRHHHTMENGAFPLFEKQFPELAPVIERLREEHEQVEEALDRLQTLLERERESDTEKMRAELERTVAELEEHFAYEEEHLLPALLGTAGRPRSS